MQVEVETEAEAEASCGMYTARSTRTAPLSDGMRALPSVSWGVHGGGSLFVPSRRRRCVSRAPRAAHVIDRRGPVSRLWLMASLIDRRLAVRSEVAKWWIVCWALAGEPLGSF